MREWKGVYEGHAFPQWLLFFGLAYFTLAVYFGLKMIPTTPLFNRFSYYLILLFGGTIILALLIICFGIPKELPWSPDWDENWTKEHVFVYGTGVGITIGLNFLLQGIIAKYVPGPALPQELVPVPTLALIPQGWTNIIIQSMWQVCAVSGGEEIMKVSLILLFTRATHTKWPIVAGVIVIWSYAHTIISYGDNTTAVIAAVIAGSIFFAQWAITKNFQVAVLSHGSVNVIYLLPSFGFGLTSILPAASATIILPVFGLILAPKLKRILQPSSYRCVSIVGMP